MYLIKTLLVREMLGQNFPSEKILYCHCVKMTIVIFILLFIFLVIKRFIFESLQKSNMSEIELSEKSPKRDLEKSYEAVQMLNAKHDDVGHDIEKGSTKDSGEEITVRRVFRT